MGRTTKIQWTDHTFNPWWGCTKVSPGCKNCYAERDAKRYGHDVWGPGKDRRLMSDAYWDEPLKWDRDAAAAGCRPRVFCASMADVFDEDAPPYQLARLWILIRQTPNLDWLLLTKRPENFSSLLPVDWGDGWPNVWLGTSVESQRYADERIPHLLDTSAVVHFLSCEPILGPVDLRNWLTYDWRPIEPGEEMNRVDWVIVGGESGPGAGSVRPFDLAWARTLRDQCLTAGVSFFMKQLGTRPVDDGHEVLVRDRKGGDIDEFPEDLRIREWPR